METSEDMDFKDEINALGDKPETGSVLDRLRAIREDFQGDQTHDLEVPGYRGQLIARYSPLPWDVIRALAMKGDRGRRNPQIAPMIAADGLANAIVGFFYPEGDERLPLTYKGEPVERFDKSLADALGIETTAQTTTREIVRAVFPDEFALVAHYGAFSEWQGQREEEGEAEVEARAAKDDAVHPTLT